MQSKALCCAPVRENRRFFPRQMLIMAKLTAFFLLVATFSVSARSFSQSVTLHVRDVSLEKVFFEIEKQTGYNFVYNNRVLASAKPVTIAVNEAAVDEVLKLVLKDQPFNYQVKDKTIVISPRNAAVPNVDAPPLNIDAHGRVTNEKGDPVAGVTVTLKGSKKMTATDENGEFTLKGINENGVLVFTSVNMETLEVKVNGRNDFVVALKTKTTALEDVAVTVNTGYQKVSKERFVGSFAQLDSTDFHRRVGMGIIERLDGTVPGVVFDKKGFNFPIQIRGINTLGIQNTNTSPLFIIDNFVVQDSRDLLNLNPNDVESVTVLKDAAALSIWGARGGNGVIVVTTKRGKYNQRFHLSVSSNVTVEEKPDLYYVPLISTSDYIDYEQYLFGKGIFRGFLSNLNRPLVSPVVEILSRQSAGLISSAEATAKINALRNKDIRKDLDRYFYRQGIRQQHYVGFDGGNNILSYQFSLGYNHSLNNIQGTKPDDVYTLATNASFRPIKNLEISAGINYSLGIQKSYTLNLQGLYPYLSLVDSLGNPAAIPYTYRQGYIDTVGGGQLLDWHYRPLDEARLADINNTTQSVRLNFGVNYKFTNWLRADIRYQLSNIIFTSRNYKSLSTFETRDLINAFTNLSQTAPYLRYPVPVGGIMDASSSLAKSQNIRGSLQFDRTWPGYHQLTVMAGGELSDTKGGFSEGQRIYGYDDSKGTLRNTMDFNNPYPKFYAVYPGRTGYILSNTSYKLGDVFRIVSAFANASYAYKNRYNLYASARRDGTNVFGVETNNKWKPIWSIGAAWEISKEAFYHLDWLPYAKLRLSHGYTGNVNNTLPGQFVLSNLPYVDQLSNLPYSIPGLAPNANLRWESDRIENIGLDFQLLKRRLSGSFEVFVKHSDDVISRAPMPPSSGVNVFTLNYANLKTNGYEITLNSINLNKGLIQWTTNFSLSHAKTILTKFYGGNAYNKASQFISYGLNPTEGQMPFVIAGYRWAGLDSLNGDPMGYLNGQVSKNYTNIANDTSKNQTVFGSALPLYTGFIRNTITWKGFSLSFNITGRFGYYYREPSLAIDFVAFGSPRTLYTTDFYSRWQKPGDEARTNVPSLSYPGPGSSRSGRTSFYQFAEIHIKRADNIKLQDIRFSYQWNNKRVKLPVHSIQVYVYPNNLNLILWSKEKLKYDPDFTGGGDATSIVKPVKTWTMGVTINF